MKTSIMLALVISAPLVSAQTALSPDKGDIPAAQKIYSPYVERTARDKNFAEGLYWGDTHLHTRYFSDSGMIGNKLGPDEAYRFAKGEEVTSSTGQRARLIRPLDFLVISDHAENLGLAPMIAESNSELLKTEYGKKWHDMVKDGEGYEAFREWAGSIFTGDRINSKKMQRTVWTDPDFNPKHQAVYYTRVLEIPTPTWQAYDAQFYGTKMPEQVPLSHQERAYTSPIWYTPGS